MSPDWPCAPAVPAVRPGRLETGAEIGPDECRLAGGRGGIRVDPSPDIVPMPIMKFIPSRAGGRRGGDGQPHPSAS